MTKKQTKELAIMPAPAVPSTEIMPSTEHWKQMNEQAEMLVQSGFLPPQLKRKEQALALILKGYELRIPAMQAISQLYVVGQKIGIQGEGMLALIRSRCPGARIDFLETSAKRCEIEAERPGSKAYKFTFTIQDAQAMQLIDKPGGNYKKQPEVMLQWRCVAKMARAMFSDILMGCVYTPDELDDGFEGAKDVKSEVVNTTDKLNQQFSGSALPETTQNESKPAPAVEDQSVRDDLMVQLNNARKTLGMDPDAFTQRIFKMFSKQPKMLTTVEMKMLLDALNSDIAGK